MSNKYRKQTLPTDTEIDGEYVFIACGGDSLGHLLGSFKNWGKAKKYLTEEIVNSGNKHSFSRYSISAIPLDADFHQKPYFTVFYDETSNPAGGYNVQLEEAMESVFG